MWKWSGVLAGLVLLVFSILSVWYAAGCRSSDNRWNLGLTPVGMVVFQWFSKEAMSDRVIFPGGCGVGPQTTIVRWLPGGEWTRANVSICLPLWPFILIVSFVTARSFRRDRPVPPGHCPSCRYNLTGCVSGGRCPECGHEIAVRATLGPE